MQPMQILWKMPSTKRARLWKIKIVYDDFVMLESQDHDANALIDLSTGEGMIAKERRRDWLIGKFRVSDSLNDVLVDRLDGIERLGVSAPAGIESGSDKPHYH